MIMVNGKIIGEFIWELKLYIKIRIKIHPLERNVIGIIKKKEKVKNKISKEYIGQKPSSDHTTRM